MVCIKKLNSIKKVEYLSNNTMTNYMLADYFDVSCESIKKISTRYKDEFIQYKSIIKGVELKKLKECNQLGMRTTKLSIYSIDSIYKFASLLTESEVADKIRNMILKEDISQYENIFGKDSRLRFKRYEEEIGNYLTFSFGKENILSQVRCGKYNLDFVLFDKIHIEVDEHGHLGYDGEKEYKRSKYIKKNTNYITIRYNPHKDKPYILIEKILKSLKVYDEIA